MPTNRGPGAFNDGIYVSGLRPSTRSRVYFKPVEEAALVLVLAKQPRMFVCLTTKLEPDQPCVEVPSNTVMHAYQSDLQRCDQLKIEFLFRRFVSNRICRLS